MKTFKVIILLLLMGCSAQWHMNKALKKDPGIIVSDTVVQIDTLWIEVAKVDTLFRYNYDTVEYYLDSVYVKYHYDTITKQTYIEVDCPDCPEITNTVTVTDTIRVGATWQEKLKLILLGAGGMFLILFIVKYINDN